MIVRDSASVTVTDTNLERSTGERGLLERMTALAESRLSAHAERGDRERRFPADSFSELARHGFLQAAIPKHAGGHGLGPGQDDCLTLWMLTRAIGRVDLSLARCWEGHCNALSLIAGVANDVQKRRWFDGVIERGEIWAAWSGEPQMKKPGQHAIGTTVARVPGGYRIRGSKVFATAATGAHWAVLLVSTAGPGGARHATGAVDAQLMLCCELSDPSVSTDGRWWDPIGMRATESHKVLFEDTFIPDEQAIGVPGQYLRDRWQARFTPHYAASFLGAAEGAYDEAIQYIGARKKSDDPYVQHRVAEMRIALDTANLWLAHTARLWHEKDVDNAEGAGITTRLLVERLATSVVEHAIHICGARSLIRPSRLERIFRDLSFYVRHDSADQVLATIGKLALGSSHDVSFFSK